MRADAYKHFNQAVILATILRDPPAVVSAAADPIGKIDNLGVLSTDGASEIVRTTTNNLTQAGHAIESLTGINVAQVFTNALENANLTGSDEERAIGAREPDTRAEVDLNVTTTDASESAKVQADEDEQTPA